MDAVRNFPKERVSILFLNSLSKKALTPFTLVKTSQSYVAIFLIAASRGFQSSGGTIFIVGHSKHSAPRSERN
jgi:hypothetical protein